MADDTHSDDVASRTEWQRIARKVRLTDDLWTRLQHVKWGSESFALLGRMVDDLRQSISAVPDERVNTLVQHLHQLLATSGGADPALTAAACGRVSALIEALQQALPEEARPTVPGEFVDSRTLDTSSRRREVAIITRDIDLAALLASDLEAAGFKIRQYDDLTLAVTDLKSGGTSAVICEANVGENDLDGVQAMVRLRKEMPVPPAILFISERGDLASRLAAIRAGGLGFYFRPVQTDIVIDRLRATLGGVGAEGLRVLVVDDEEDAAEYFCRALEAAGVSTAKVLNPVQLLQVMYRYQPDLVLMDVHLGEVSGIELAQVLRQHESYSDVPIVFISGDDSTDTHLALLNAGGDDFLVKPVEKKSLLAAVLNRLHRARDTNRRQRLLSGQDAVSHLANRRRFVADLEKLLPGIGIGIPSVAALLISVENFPALRERAGIAGCDRVLVHVGRRLRNELRPGDIVARYGDAGFAVMMLGHNEMELTRFCESLRDSLEQRDFDAGGRSFMLDVAIGATISRSPDVSALEIMEQTELAIRLARENDARIYVHDSREDGQAQRTREEELAAQIRESLKQSRLRLLFQPIVGLGEDRQERYEVLVRMRDKFGDDLLPETVFAVAERVGLGDKIDRSVVGRVLAILAERGLPRRKVELFVNVCRDLFEDREFAEWLRERIAAHGVSPESLVFEVSEQQLAHQGIKASDFIAKVRGLGCRASIERFGRAENAILMLSRTPVDYVKLDPSLVEGVEKDRRRYEELRRLVASTRKLGPEIIAGGVENPSTLGALFRCEIHLAQGFFLQEPFGEMAYDFDGNSL